MNSNPFSTPISITKEVSATTHVRLDLVGSFDMPSRWRNDLMPFHTTAALAAIVNGTGAKVILRPAVKKGMVTITAHYYDGNIDTAEFSVGEALDITDSAWTFILTPLAVLNIQEGCDIEVYSSWPPKSGLGGSGAIKAAMIKALLLVRHETFSEPYPTPQYVTQIAHMIDHVYTEDWDPMDVMMSLENSGIANWLSDGRYLFTEFNQNFLTELEDRIVLGYTFEQHHAGVEGSKRTASIHKGEFAKEWQKFARAGQAVVEALLSEDLSTIINSVNEFTHQKVILSPAYLSEKHQVLLDITKKYHGGFKPMGAGKGGCALAILPSAEDKEKVISAWKNEGVQLLPLTLLSPQKQEKQYYCSDCGSLGLGRHSAACMVCGKMPQ